MHQPTTRCPATDHWPFAPLTEAQHRARSVQEAAIRREAARAEYEARNRCRVRQQGGAQ